VKRRGFQGCTCGEPDCQGIKPAYRTDPYLVTNDNVPLVPRDLRPCTRCGLRGHVAGDPDRCLYYRGSFGLGGQAAQAADEAHWRNGTGRGGDH
jgi:hypothetical protein